MIYSMIAEHFYFGELAFYMLACWATWMTGTALAKSWRPMASLLVYSLLLAAAVRFLHYALYSGPFISPLHYVSDLVVLGIIGVIAYRYTRTNQMVRQYHWLFERASPLSWKAK